MQYNAEKKQSERVMQSQWGTAYATTPLMVIKRSLQQEKFSVEKVMRLLSRDIE